MAVGKHSWWERISGSEAEAIHGSKLYKRKTYYKKTAEGLLTDNHYAFPGHDVVFVYDEFKCECSGCDGAGCQECGNHGHRLDGLFTPLKLEKLVK